MGELLVFIVRGVYGTYIFIYIIYEAVIQGCKVELVAL